MADMPTLRDIANDTAADATDVEWNFNTIETHIENSVLRTDGQNALAANFDAGSQKIINLGTPTVAADAATKAYVDTLETQLVSVDGTVGMAADLNMNANKLVDVAAGTAATDGVNKTQMDAAVAAGVEAKLPGGVSVRIGTNVLVTDASQEVTVPFGLTFTGTPIVVPVNGDRTAASFATQINGKSATTFTVRCEGAGVGVTVRIDWIAVGVVV